jgi:hypothetical protein
MLMFRYVFSILTREDKNKKQNPQSLTCIIQALYSGQMQGVGSRRHSILFQGFGNVADGLRRMPS